MTYFRIPGLALFVLSIAFTTAWADPTPELLEFHHTVAAGVHANGGNSEAVLLNLEYNAKQTGEEHEILLHLNYSYGEATNPDTDVSETNVDKGSAALQGNQNLTERVFAYLRGDWERDDIADVQYRVRIGPGLGRSFGDETKTLLKMEGGLSWLTEKVGGLQDEYVVLRLAERLDIVLSPTAELWQSLEILPTLEEPDELLLNAEVGLEAMIRKDLSLRWVGRNAYDSDPAAGNEKNDFTVIASIVYTLP